MKSQDVHAMMAGDDRSLGGHALRALTGLVAPGYAGAIAARNALFDAGWRQVKKLGRPTLSVGNLTTGGTGKTPMVMGLARQLLAMRVKPGILLRGYAAGEAGSDEAAVYRAAFESRVPVEANPDRAAAAERMLKTHDDVQVFLLDDGFQRRQVHRDVDLVLIDAVNPWGYGHLLPRGMLREPVASLRRADAVVLTHADEVDAARLQRVRERIESLTGRPPIAESSHAWDDYACWSPAGDRGVASVDALRDRRVLGVCGIGNPTAFERQLRAHGGDVAGCVVRPDHATYAAADLTAIARQAADEKVAAVVTTEKDFVKWQPLLDAVWPAAGPAIYRPRLSLAFSPPHAANITALLQSLVSPSAN